MKIPAELGTKSIRSVFIIARKWHGALHGRRWPVSLAAAGFADLDAAAVFCLTSRRRRYQAAANDAVVLLWVRVRAVRMATGRGARTPRSPDPPAVHVERGSPAAAPRRCARVARGAEHTLLPQPHQRTPATPPRPSRSNELRRPSPAGVDRRRYVYGFIKPGEALELVREFEHPRNRRA